MIDFIYENLTIIIIVLIVLIGLWYAARIITKPGKPVEIIYGDFTIEQLNEFNGQIKPQIFLALKGVIYDVSGSWFYRKGAPYGKFAGHDASLNLAKMSHDEKLFDKWGQYPLNSD